MKHVVIVGAGVVGLACALRLARQGARVTVLEAEPDDLNVFRPGASAAAAGMLAPFDADAGAHAELMLASFDLWKASSPGAAWAEGVRFEGGLIALEEEADAAALQARAMQAGRAVAALSSAQAQKRLGFSHRLKHTLFVEDEGVADPFFVLSGLALEARNHGVRILYDQDVSDCTPNLVRTFSDQAFEADHVVLAPGAWASKSMISAAPALAHIRPGKGHLVAVELGKGLGPNLHAPDFYLSRRREDIVLGATMQIDRFDRGVEQAEVEALLARAEAAAPGAIRSTGRAWTGIRPMSPDGWPLIGPSRDLLVAAGHSRHGWLLAPITAEIINAYVHGVPILPAWAALSPQRFDP